MADEGTRAQEGRAAGHELYTSRANPEIEALFARRTGAVEAAFFLPYLRPGMRLLDCGSGTGSITVDLAEVAAPGEVIGLDIQASQVERARALAGERGVDNVRFEAGSIYALPFPDAAFDAAFAHQVLYHLGDPGAALREIRRVLKPGGVAGIRDIDWGLWLFSPPSPRLEAFMALRIRVLQHHGGSPFYARHQRQLLLEADFARSEATAEFAEQGAGSLAKTQRAAVMNAALLRGPAFRETALGQGWADETELDAMDAELQAWGQRPDALQLLAYCQAIGWVDA